MTANYTITYAKGTLTVNKKAITITADSANKTYDGTALTKSTYTNTALAEGDTLTSVTVTGSQTNAGSNDNVPSAAVIKNAGGTDVTASYDITYTNGTLTVNKKAITITADDASKTYDGTALTSSGYSITSGSLAEGDSIESVTVTGNQTNVGNGDNVPSNAAIKRGNAYVTDNYAITYAKGTLTVNKRAVTVSGITANNKTYDGTTNATLNYSNVTLDGKVGNDNLTVTATGAFADANAGEGKSVNISGLTLGGTAAGNYVLAASGQQNSTTATISKKAVTITADSDSKTYDGTALTKSTYTNTALAAGDTITSVTVTGSQAIAGSSDNVPSAAVIKNAGGTDVTASYDITYTKGTLKVTQKAITITADDASKTYDGTALTKSTYTNTALAEGDSIESVTVTGSRTIAGETPNVPSAAVIKNASGADVTANYNITYTNGTLTVNQRPIIVQAKRVTKVYDGTAQTEVEAAPVTTSGLADDDTITLETDASGTTVGTYDNHVTKWVVENSAGEDVTDSYSCSKPRVSSLTIVPRPIIITASSANKTYDGTALTKNTYTSEGLATGDSIDSVTVTGSQTNAGSSDNVPSEAVIKRSGVDVTENYEITYANGALTVNPRTVVLAWEETALTYTGSAQAPAVTITNKVDGDKVNVTVTGAKTNAGSYTATAAALTGADAGNYVLPEENTTPFSIAQMALTIKANDATKTYDGTALTNNSYTITSGTLFTGHSLFKVTVTGSQTAAGSSDNVPSGVVIRNAGGTDVTANYDITLENGTLTVNNKDISTAIITLGEALTYTGEEQTQEIASVKVDGLTVTYTVKNDSNKATDAGDHTLTITGTDNFTGEATAVYNIAKAQAGVTAPTANELTYTGEAQVLLTAGTSTQGEMQYSTSENSGYSTTIPTGTNAGSYTVYYKVVGTDNYAGTDPVPVIVTIAPKTVTATVELSQSSYTYDATEKTPTVTVKDGETVIDSGEYTVSYSNNTNAGTATVTVSDNANGNYTVSGSTTFTINPKPVTITAASDSKTYDGTALTNSGHSITDGSLVEGDTYTVTVTGSRIFAGETPNVPSAARIVNSSSVDVTANYAITYVNGTITINQKDLTITAASAKKVYDTTALTKDAYTFSGLLNSDRIQSVTITGSQTAEGSSDNVPSNAVITNRLGINVTDSYNITYVNGTLTVTPLATTIYVATAEFEYNGKYQTGEIAATFLLPGDEFIGADSRSRRDVGSNVNIPSNAVIHNAAGEDVSSSYIIAYETGSITITAKPLRGIEWTTSIMYNGYDQTPPALALDLCENEDGVIDDVTVTVEGAQKNVGTGYTATATGITGADAGNYVFGAIPAADLTTTFEITKAPLTITANPNTITYGEAPSDADITITGLLGDDTRADLGGELTFSYDYVQYGDVGYYTITPSGLTSDNYEITFETGVLTVVPKAITVDGITASDKDYDGNTLATLVYTGAAFHDTVNGDVLSVTGTGTFSDIHAAEGKTVTISDLELHGDKAGNYVLADEGQQATTTATIRQILLTITAASASKDYDSTELTNSNYTSEGLLTGDSIASITVEGSQTNAGSSANVASAALIVNDDSENVTDCYAITYVDGTLTVNKINVTVTITGHNNTTDYDGEEHTRWITTARLTRSPVTLRRRAQPCTTWSMTSRSAAMLWRLVPTLARRTWVWQRASSRTRTITSRP